MAFTTHDGRVQAILLMGAALNWLGAAKLFMEALLADDCSLSRGQRSSSMCSYSRCEHAQSEHV